MTKAKVKSAKHKNHDIYVVPGLQRGLRVLEIVATAGQAVSISSIAETLGLTRSSVFRLIYTLRDMGFLEEAEHTRLLTLGPRVLNIGFAFLASKDIIEIAKPILENLRDTTSVSAHLAIRDQADVLYLSCVQTRSGFLSNMNVGSRVSAHASPMGWLLLADMPDQALDRLFAKRTFPALTDQTPRSFSALRDRIKESRRRGYVTSIGMMEAGGSSISAPVLDQNGHVVAAIDISGPDSAFDLKAIESRYVPLVTMAAKHLSERLGYQGTPTITPR